MKHLFSFFLAFGTSLGINAETNTVSDFIGNYNYVDGTNFNECPAGNFEITEVSSGLQGYGTTGMDAWGPFANAFYFTDINEGVKTSSAGEKNEYRYETVLLDNTLVSNKKFVIKSTGKILLEEEQRFRITSKTAILEHRLISNTSSSRQIRHKSFICLYER